jgi:hypothetical protein
MTYQLTRCASVLAFATISFAAAALERAENFVLLDNAGRAQELYYSSDAAAVMLVAQSNDCADSSDWRADLDAFHAANPDVRIMLINSLDSRAEIAEYAERTDARMPILHDSAQIIGQSLQLKRSGEAVVMNPETWQIVYRGPVEEQAIAATMNIGHTAEEQVSPTLVNATGCEIAYTGHPEVPDYAADVVPILERNCRACHIEGGIAPWAMSEYIMIKGFAPMMREVVRVKRMPPWHADPAVGQWQHSAAMNDADTQTLIRWIDAGAPRGEGEDPLLAAKKAATTWPLGEPDLILNIPSYDVPASGVVDYQFPIVANPLDHDVWVVAATIVPGDTRVVHHVLMGSAEKAPEESDRESVFQNYIMGYAPGNESAHMPEGTGVFVPVGGVYQFQMHYTPTGITTTDATRVALYFAEEPPANFLRQQVVLNPRIRIPANEAAHVESAYFEFWDDATIYSLVPHSHYRGKSSTFELIYPDGSEELILSVPNYDFNWQRTYSFTEPKVVPKGTKIVHRTTYDNSVNNPSNPDPDREVPWGLQSHDEMLYGSVSFAWNNERSDAPMHSNLTSGSAQFVGFLDKDMDGKLAKDELPDRMRERLGWFKWWFVDTNFDGGLDVEEIEAMFSGD